MKEWHEVTGEERDAIAQAALDAAFEELKPLNDKDVKMEEKVIAVINAFRAAKKAEEYGGKQLEREVGKSVICCIDIFSVVASAVYALDFWSTEGIHHYALGGEKIEAMARAVIVMRGVYMMWDAFDDEEDAVFGIYLDKEAGILADRLSKKK